MINDQAVYKRNAKFWGIEFTEEFEDAFNRTNSTLNRISRYVRKHIKSGDITNITKLGYVSLRDGVMIDGELKYELTKAQFKNSIQHLFDKDSSNESLKRECVLYVLERYAGYFQRNGQDKVPNISFKRKGLYYKDNFVAIDQKAKYITLPTIYGVFKLRYNCSLKENFVVKPKFGGHFIWRQKAFVVAVDVPFELLYTPLSVLSFDLNKTAKDNVVCNDGEIIPSSAKMAELVKKIKELNEKLDPDKKKPVAKRKRKSKQRRPIRLEWKEAHRRLRNECKKVVMRLVEKAEESKSLMCIDSVKTGQTMGTFGQDHIIPELQKECENRGIPFYVVPCRNTSRRCPECGHIHADNRKDTKTFKCVSCGHEADAQLNAAINIADIGQMLYDGEVPYGNYAKRNVEKLISSYQKESIPVSAE
tara:strand:- start:804 stop:2060 length:1257 start_codon:yes stop_codon:yes gene_type:complete